MDFFETWISAISNCSEIVPNFRKNYRFSQFFEFFSKPEFLQFSEQFRNSNSNIPNHKKKYLKILFYYLSIICLKNYRLKLKIMILKDFLKFHIFFLIILFLIFKGFFIWFSRIWKIFHFLFLRIFIIFIYFLSRKFFFFFGIFR